MSRDAGVMVSFKIPFREKWLLNLLERDSKQFDMSRSRLIIKILKAHYFIEDHS